MKKRIYTSVAIVLTLALLFVLKVYVSDYFFDAFFAVVACFAAFEMARMMTKIGRFNFQYVATAFPCLLLAGNLIGIHFCAKTGDLFWVLYTILIDLGLVIVVSLGLFLWGIIFRRKTRNEMSVREIKDKNIEKFSFKKALNTLLCFVYPAFLFLFFILINHFHILAFDGNLDSNDNRHVRHADRLGDWREKTLSKNQPEQDHFGRDWRDCLVPDFLRVCLSCLWLHSIF